MAPQIIDSWMNLLNYSVIAICMIMKLPQIRIVIKNNSTLGLDLKSLLMEFWCFTWLMAYPYANGYPIFGYLEHFLLAFQDSILLWLVLRDRRNLNVFTMSLYALYLSAVFSMAMGLFSQRLTFAIMSTVTPLSAISKILQIASLYKRRDAGNISMLTWAMATYSASARTITNLFGTADFLLIVTSLQAAVLNFVILVSVWHFKRSKKQA